jgi:sarcosine oxidase subunit gamma
MAELMARRHVLHSRADALDALDAMNAVTSVVTVVAEPDAATVDVRVPAAVADRGASVLGTPLPLRPNTWTGGAERQVVWLGPDEWLVRCPTRSPEELETSVRADAAALGGVAVDVSAQRTCLRVTGPRARSLLATGFSLDLHPRTFRSGHCAQTAVAQASVILMALDDHGTDYRILVRSSFAGYLADWMIDAAEEFRSGSG